LHFGDTLVAEILIATRAMHESCLLLGSLFEVSETAFTFGAFVRIAIDHVNERMLLVWINTTDLQI